MLCYAAEIALSGWDQTLSLPLTLDIERNFEMLAKQDICLETVETFNRCTLLACTKPKPSIFAELYPALNVETVSLLLNSRCGNVAAILELDEHLKREFTIFEAAPQVRVSFY